MDVNNSHKVATGIEAGISDKPISTQGTVLSGVDLTLSSKSVNDLISGLNGWGSFNLGKVTPNFYIKLQALEKQGFLKLRSTPKLSTLNGHLATLSIGQKEYYLESTNSIINSQTPQNYITQQYKPVEANLSISINPIVSSSSKITLEIEVNQSSFTDRIAETAPPGTNTRTFKSLIRVGDGEMIILGGLEEASISDSGSGIPFLSRIPIIKWFFSSRTRAKSNNKLTIFVKPTVIY
jgi:type IV pilus assembly protein PilQ